MGEPQEDVTGEGTSFPWAGAGSEVPVVEAAVPVAWLGRTSTEDQQDPTLSLPRQLSNARQALPPGYVIVAHFYDVESGRKDLEQRGLSMAHERFDIPIPRDGGIKDLLAEAARPGRRFVAVICESIDRVARRTYFGVKIEYELEQAGVILLAADEPIPTNWGRAGGGSQKRSTPILTRRVKQAVAEWYVLQMLEQSWDGLKEHSTQGWNIGPAAYGYQLQRVPHPVPSRRAEGKTKSRLSPDPVTGPVVTEIYRWRVVERLGYREIADRLNDDPERYPPPRATVARRTVGRWTRSAVCGILKNPKYTGYMVWNRRATTSKKGRCNPESEWVWSPRPVHEPLVTMDLFRAAQAVAGRREKPRRTPVHMLKHSYILRSYVVCDHCDRRMQGKRRHNRSYYTCWLNHRHHEGRRDWYENHPASLWIQQDYLFAAVKKFFADRIFGVHRRDLLARQLGELASDQDDRARQRRAKLDDQLQDLKRRRGNLVSQLEEDDGNDREFRNSIQTRFKELGSQLKAIQDEIVLLEARSASKGGNDASLLDVIPQIPMMFDEMPEELLRKLWGVFRLQIRYNAEHRTAIIRVSLRADTAEEIAKAARQEKGGGMDGVLVAPNYVLPREYRTDGRVMTPARPVRDGRAWSMASWAACC